MGRSCLDNPSISMLLFDSYHTTYLRARVSSYLMRDLKAGQHPSRQQLLYLQLTPQGVADRSESGVFAVKAHLYKLGIVF